MTTNIFQKKHDDKQEKEAERLANFQKITDYAAQMANEELPRIEEVLFRIDEYNNQTFGKCPESQLPNNIRQLLFQIDAVRGTPGTVRSALAERVRVRAEDLPPNLAPSVTANFCTRLSFARGCAGSVERLFVRVQLEVDRFRQLHDASYEEPKVEVPFMVPPKSEEPTTATDRFNPRQAYKKQTV